MSLMQLVVQYDEARRNRSWDEEGYQSARRALAEALRDVMEDRP